jgi:hypothetical protein
MAEFGLINHWVNQLGLSRSAAEVGVDLSLERHWITAGMCYK